MTIRLQPFLLLILALVSMRTAIADPYTKNPNIDIVHYRFQLTFTDDSDRISGSADITALFKTEGIREIRLDLISMSEGKGMKVDSVTMGNISLDYIHRDNALTIDLGKSSNENTEQKLTVYYGGIPVTGLIIGPNKYGDRTFFSDNWPNKARNWLPTVDHPSDKATSEMIIFAPVKYQVISNGLLMEESNLEDGMKKTHWKQSVPISCWLYVVGVAEFAVQYVDEFHGKSIQTWVYKQDRDAGFYDFAVPTKRALAFYDDYVGPFQYEKLANVQSNSVGGGMEAASAILYGDNSVTGTRETRWRNVIIHEIAHQWFGNAVTESSWDDVWLSEGFATYFTLLFREFAYGREDFVDGLKQARERVYNFYKDNKDYTIVHDNLQDMANVTTGQIYQRGAWILHMLRNQVGDENFEIGIKNYYRKYVNGTATTADFQREIENVSGQELDWFFTQWLNQGGHIILDGKWSYNEATKTVKISLSKVNDDGYDFRFPIEIGIHGDETLPEIKSMEFNESSLEISIPVDSRPSEVAIDPRTVLLAEWTFSEE